MKKFDVQELLEVRESLKTQELKERIDKILCMLEEGETFEVVDDGKVIAHVVPASEAKQSIKPESDEAWENLKRLSAELSAHWPKGVSAVDAVRDVRW